MFEATLCEMIKDGKILLKKATRGVSKSKWNGLGGKLEGCETPKENVIREVKEESNLTMKDLKNHGVITFYQGSVHKVFAIVHVFSSHDFEGEIKGTEEGDLEWFDLNSIPYDDMWADDPYWMQLLLDGKEFDAEFLFDESMEKILDHKIRIRP
ncbi:MAG: 8-oxo-dGTP diphosphatase [Candidatus Aenigmatarchaeota archaeon]